MLSCLVLSRRLRRCALSNTMSPSNSPKTGPSPGRSPMGPPGSPGSTRGGAGAMRKGRPADLVLPDTAARSADRDGTQSHGPSNTAEWTPKTRFKNTKSYSPRPSGVGGMDSPGMLVRRKQADKMVQSIGAE